MKKHERTKETTIQVGNKRFFDGWKLIVMRDSKETEVLKISEKVAESLIESGVPSEG